MDLSMGSENGSYQSSIYQNATNMTKVRLVAKEGNTVYMDLKVAMMIPSIKNMLDVIIASGRNVEEVPIPIPQVSSVMLEIILEWTSHYYNAMGGFPEPEPIDEWASDFLDCMCIHLRIQLYWAAAHLRLKHIMITVAKFEDLRRAQVASQEEAALVNQMSGIGFQ